MKEVISLFPSPQYWWYHLLNATKSACQFSHVILLWKNNHVSRLSWGVVHTPDTLTKYFAYVFSFNAFSNAFENSTFSLLSRLGDWDWSLEKMRTTGFRKDGVPAYTCPTPEPESLTLTRNVIHEWPPDQLTQKKK